jgi:hypothetical protein
MRQPVLFICNRRLAREAVGGGRGPSHVGHCPIRIVSPRRGDPSRLVCHLTDRFEGIMDTGDSRFAHRRTLLYLQICHTSFHRRS